MIKFLYILVLAALLVIPTHAQDGPSMEETVEFIKGKVAFTDWKAEGRSHSYKIENFSIKNCVLDLKYRGTHRGNGDTNISIHEVNLNFGDLTPSETKKFYNDYRKRYYLNVEAYNGREAIKIRNEDSNSWSRVKGTSLSSAQVEDELERLEKAVNHLITLCGGKKEAF